MTAPVVYSDTYTFDWPGHIFPTGKYRAVARALRERGSVASFVEPEPATEEQILTCHDPAYLAKLHAIADGREAWDPRFECPVSREILDAFVLSAGGTTLAGRLACEGGRAANLGGGFHHAYPDHGEGFCLLNDVPVAAKTLLHEGVVSRVLIVDLDVHQGNGTAVMCRDEPRIFTLSVHQQNNYPPKEVSDLDVGLPDLADDALYLGALDEALGRVAEGFVPELVLYLAGADPFEQDRLGGLAVTKEGLAARDRMVFEFADRVGAAVVGLLAGGYAVHEEDVVDIHVTMVEQLLMTRSGSDPNADRDTPGV
jgi:acetoin utilization deacetylase AcuC-like enzyme